jgi:hypothetical protein
MWFLERNIPLPGVLPQLANQQPGRQQKRSQSQNLLQNLKQLPSPNQLSRNRPRSRLAKPNRPRNLKRLLSQRQLQSRPRNVSQLRKNRAQNLKQLPSQQQVLLLQYLPVLIVVTIARYIAQIKRPDSYPAFFIFTYKRYRLLAVGISFFSIGTAPVIGTFSFSSLRS